MAVYLPNRCFGGINENGYACDTKPSGSCSFPLWASGLKPVSITDEDGKAIGTQGGLVYCEAIRGEDPALTGKVILECRPCKSFEEYGNVLLHPGDNEVTTADTFPVKYGCSNPKTQWNIWPAPNNGSCKISGGEAEIGSLGKETGTLINIGTTKDPNNFVCQVTVDA